MAAGHEVAVCTADGFRDLVRGAGVHFLPMGSDMLDLLQAAMPRLAGPADALRLIRRMTAAMRTACGTPAIVSPSSAFTATPAR